MTQSICIHRGIDPIGEKKCASCRGNVVTKLFACRVHSMCAVGPTNSPPYQIVPGRFQVCSECPDRPKENEWVSEEYVMGTAS